MGAVLNLTQPGGGGRTQFPLPPGEVYARTRPADWLELPEPEADWLPLRSGLVLPVLFAQAARLAHRVRARARDKNFFMVCILPNIELRKRGRPLVAFTF